MATPEGSAPGAAAAAAVSAPRGGAAARRGGRVRSAVFPIYGREEIGKFCVMGLMKFCIVFVLTITRDAKDSLIVTNCGAEAISFLKLYGSVPAATAFLYAYGKMSDALSDNALFVATCLPFFAFFLLFSEVLYPLFAQGRLPAPAGLLRFFDRLPGGFRFARSLVEKWPLALFYVISELYSSVSIGILFWQSANHVTDVGQAKRFYPLFGQVSSLAPIAAGQMVVMVTRNRSFDESLRVLTAALTVCGACIVGLHRYAMHHYAPKRDPRAGGAGETSARAAQGARPAGGGRSQGGGTDAGRKGRSKPSLVQSYKFLAQSAYLRNVAVGVVSYGLAINFTEILWKSMVRRGLPEPRDYQRFMAQVSSLVGAATFVVIFLGSNLVKHLGWTVGALTTPIAMGSIALPLFLAVLTTRRLGWPPADGAEAGKAAAASIRAAMVVGAMQSVMSKATKYAVFDPTTQMAYIPLDQEAKVKGKAAIDVLGSRLGKSGGSLIQQLCIVGFGNIINAAPAVALMFYAVIANWLLAVRRLSVLFDEASRRQQQAADREER